MQAGKRKLLQAGKMLQESGRSKASRKGKVAPSIDVMEEIPQPEAKGKQVNWAKSWKTSHKAPVGFGRGGDSGTFRTLCTAFCGG